MVVFGDATAVSVAHPPGVRGSHGERDGARGGELVLASRGACAALVIALTAFAFAVRVMSTNWLLPMHVNPDEHVFAEQLALMRSGTPAPELDPRYGYYPQLVPRVAWLATSAPRMPSTNVLAGDTRAPAAGTDSDASTLAEGAEGDARTLAEHLKIASHDLVALRGAVAWLSLLVVPATYLLARRFLARPAALLAAGLAAASLSLIHI